MENVEPINFLGIEDNFCRKKESFFEIISIPYERTTSYGMGTSKAPEAIIEASQYVELYDEQFGFEAYKKGIYTSKPVDVEGEIETVFERIEKKIKESLKTNKFPICLGGEHTITFPVYKGFRSVYNNLSILHFDAHSDLRESYEGNIYSHASVMHRIAGLGDPIVQVGIRSQCIEEAEFIRENGIHTFYAHEIVNEGFNKNIIEYLSPNVFITVDVDFFDPAIMPSTGTPEPGGFHWYETIKFVKQVFNKKNVVGFDVVELAPQIGTTHPDFFAAKLIYKLMNLKLYNN